LAILRAVSLTEPLPAALTILFYGKKFKSITGAAIRVFDDSLTVPSIADWLMQNGQHESDAGGTLIRRQ
jgi:hypothetical protein